MQSRLLTDNWIFFKTHDNNSYYQRNELCPMKDRFFDIFVLAVGLIFGSILTASPLVMTQYYAYASTDTEEEDNADMIEDDSSEQQNDTESETGDEDQIQELSGSGGKKMKDMLRPTIVSKSPNVDTVTIPVNTDVKVTFSEPVQSSSLSNFNIHAKK